MHQSEVGRFERSKTNDMIVTFLPIVLVFALRSVLRTADIPNSAFFAAQLVMALFLVAVFVLSYRFYFRTFRYTLVDLGRQERGYPAGSLTFERLMGDKARIYERVLSPEVLCLLEPGQEYDEKTYGAPAKTYDLTALPRSSAHRLYYRQESIVYCALFHPDPEQVEILRDWAKHP